MKFQQLFMNILLISNASLLCMDQDPKNLSAFRKEFDALEKQDQYIGVLQLKTHRTACKNLLVSAQTMDELALAKKFATLWTQVAVCDCKVLTSPARALLIRYGVPLAQEAVPQDIISFLHPSVLSLFGPEYAKQVATHTKDVRNAERQPLFAEHVVHSTLPSMRKRCEEIRDQLTPLLRAIRDTQAHKDYTAKKQWEEEQYQRNQRKALMRSLIQETEEEKAAANHRQMRAALNSSNSSDEMEPCARSTSKKTIECIQQ